VNRDDDRLDLCPYGIEDSLEVLYGLVPIERDGNIDGLLSTGTGRRGRQLRVEVVHPLRDLGRRWRPETRLEIHRLDDLAADRTNVLAGLVYVKAESDLDGIDCASFSHLRYQGACLRR